MRHHAGGEVRRQRHTQNLYRAHYYVKRDLMIPMRDGVKLHTVVVVPKGATNAPILLTRTPYNASKRTSRSDSPRMLSVLPQGDEVFEVTFSEEFA